MLFGAQPNRPVSGATAHIHSIAYLRVSKKESHTTPVRSRQAWRPHPGKRPPSPLLAGVPPTRRHGPRQVVPWSRLFLHISSHGSQPLAHLVCTLPRRRLMHWHPNPGATLNSQILAEACSCAESLGGTKDGRWKTSIISYRPITRDGMAAGGRLPPDVPGELLGVALHERAGLYFSILRTQRLVLQADAAFPQVMEKLQSYKARVSLNFEVNLFPSLPLQFLL